jgi:hypothetical protein
MNNEDPIQPILKNFNAMTELVNRQQELIDRIIKIIEYDRELWKASRYLWIAQLFFNIVIIAIIFLTRR